jgi:hypothetical protein
MQTDAALPYVIVGEHKFGKLTPRDRARLLAELKAKRKTDLLANLDASGVKGEEKFHTLNDFDATLYGNGEWVEYVNSADGQAAILAAALGKHHADAETLLDGINIAGQELQLAAAVCGMTLGNADPNPLTAPAEAPPVPEPGTPGQTYGT